MTECSIVYSILSEKIFNLILILSIQISRIYILRKKVGHILKNERVTGPHVISFFRFSNSFL